MAPYDVIVIGSGPAGLTAAIYATRANLKTLVVAGAVAGGQLMITTDVENYPGFPKGIQGPELMELWREQAQRFKADFIDDDVSRVDFRSRPFKVWTSDGTHEARTVIVATGEEVTLQDLPDIFQQPQRSPAPRDALVGQLTLAEIERLAILQALERTKGNKRAAASMLGVYRPTLYGKLRKYKLGEYGKSEAPPKPKGAESSQPDARVAGNGADDE